MEKEKRQALRTALIAETKQAIAASVTPEESIIHAITTLDQLEQASHRLVKKAREWYALRHPELERRVREHEQFLAAALAPTESKSEMGAELDEEAERALTRLLQSVQCLYAERDALLAYIERAIREAAPNLALLATPKLAAQLLAKAGSLKRLATMPSGTLQLLGAETALFRHLRNKRHRSPKYGLLFQHPLIQKVPPKSRGKAARALADKLSLCAKLDYFKGEQKAAEYKKMLAQKFTSW